MGSEFAFAPGAFLLRYGSVLALFVVVALFARRRWAAGEEERRVRGVLLSGLVSILGFLLYFGGPMAILVPFLLVYAGPIILIYLVIPAFIAAALADLGLRAAGAERTRFWLGAGIVVAAAIAIIWMGVVLQWELFFGADAILEYAILALVPVSTALVWWSYLPPAPDNYAGTFE
ncbi:MAG TPA: hypothetical protein VEC11_16665 [Allosphingosinicella sp.]|nr:hypothetical protein [Allosphingosinicella sp.]